MSFFYYCDHISGPSAYFDAHETGHLKVMKKKEGEAVNFTDGMGSVFQGTIISLKKNEAIISITERREDSSMEIKRQIHVTAGLSRWDRLSILIEKAVELGVKSINIVHCEHSNYPKINLEKVEKTARKALKQCGGTVMPQLHAFKTLKETHLDGVVPVLLNPGAKSAINTVEFPLKTNVYIGPEGGFTHRELHEIRSFSDFTIEISLGKRILRLETAAIVAVAYIALS
ncbi:MAG TPA: RsmE family RNA methyltransferase [Thermotogota bacterium]|nr:RsmE family RNA methyltransferase [Thermotogota bacterium]